MSKMSNDLVNTISKALGLCPARQCDIDIIVRALAPIMRIVEAAEFWAEDGRRECSWTAPIHTQLVQAVRDYQKAKQPKPEPCGKCGGRGIHWVPIALASGSEAIICDCVRSQLAEIAELWKRVRKIEVE